tara:strand:- start:220 stop:744 length:525 start_codon:yes stop_codon:yes gene_type:complete
MSSILKVDTIQNTGGTTGLTIDSSGRVTQPTKPAWRIGRGSSVDVISGQATNTVINFDSTNNTTRRFFTQGGITVSSGVVTVPVAGIYLCGSTVRFDGIGSGYALLRMMVNSETDSGNGAYDIRGTPDAAYFSLGDSTIFDLNANDTIHVQYYVSADTDFDINIRSYFWGYLVG